MPMNDLNLNLYMYICKTNGNDQLLSASTLTLILMSLSPGTNEPASSLRTTSFFRWDVSLLKINCPYLSFSKISRSKLYDEGCTLIVMMALSRRLQVMFMRNGILQFRGGICDVLWIWVILFLIFFRGNRWLVRTCLFLIILSLVNFDLLVQRQRLFFRPFSSGCDLISSLALAAASHLFTNLILYFYYFDYFSA